MIRPSAPQFTPASATVPISVNAGPPGGLPFASTGGPTFTNATLRRVVLATWLPARSGMAEYWRAHVAPGEMRALPSSGTDEFIVESDRYERIGKFRLSPSASGLYSWMESRELNISRPMMLEASQSQGFRLDPARG